MTVREPTPADGRWQALADELGPAKSLQRIEAAAARVVSTVSVVASVLTGFGLLAAGSANLPVAGRGLAIVAAVVTFAALLAALRAQTLTVNQPLALGNATEVRTWYEKRFATRAPAARAATVLLVVGVGFAALAAVVALAAGGNDDPTIAVTRTADTVTADLTFRGLEPAEVATATVKLGEDVQSVAVFGPGADGTATRTLTAKVPPAGVVTVEAGGGGSTCAATLAPGAAPQAACRGS